MQDSINLLKVSGSLVSPEGILSHSQNPTDTTVNAVRTSSFTCQYPDLRAKVETQMAPCRQSNVSSVLGSAHPYLMVLLFNLHRSIKNQSSPSFFFINTTALAHGLKFFPIAPANIS